MVDELYRPQFHFTARQNWLNDPNGLVFYKGRYHLFFQHNPGGIDWGNMTWGHAVSSDLVHWRQLDHAIPPDGLGTVFSGSAVVDWDNTAGFQKGSEKTIACLYTAAGGTNPESAGEPFTQCIACSTDGGETFVKYDKNPVVGHIVGGNRDPKVIFHQPTGKWVMALYLDKNDYALLSSPDLKGWTRLSEVTLPQASECPDLFELPVDRDPGSRRWVFWGGNGNYLIGTFDGKGFKPDGGVLKSNWGGNSYAAQTFSDIPQSDGRRIQIAWMRGGKYPGMPFNQQMTFPCELTLRTTGEGSRQTTGLFMEPVKEIEKLHDKRHAWADLALKPGENPLAGLSGELLDVRAEIDLGEARLIAFSFRGQAAVYDVAARQLTCLGCSAPLSSKGNRIRLRFLLDRTSLEVFGNDGQIAMATCFLPDSGNKMLSIRAVGGEARIMAMEIFELRSAWK